MTTPNRRATCSGESQTSASTEESRLHGPQQDLWLAKPTPNRVTGAFHAGRLVNLLEWHLQKACLLGSSEDFDVALQVFNHLSEVIAAVTREADGHALQDIRSIREDTRLTWESEWAAEVRCECWKSLEEDPETTREEVCRQLIQLIVRPIVDKVRTYCLGFSDEREKLAFVFGECFDQIVRRKDAFRFMWIANAAGRPPIASWDELLNAPRTSMRQNPFANFNLQLGELSIDDLVLHELRGLCRRNGISTTMLSELQNPSGPPRQRTLGLLDDLDQQIREHFNRQLNGEPGGLRADEATAATPSCRLEVTQDAQQPRAIFDGVAYPISGDMAVFLQALIAADGHRVSMTSCGVRTRQVEDLPPPLRDLIEREEGKGSRIPREHLWLS